MVSLPQVSTALSQNSYKSPWSGVVSVFLDDLEPSGNGLVVDGNRDGSGRAGGYDCGSKLHHRRRLD